MRIRAVLHLHLTRSQITNNLNMGTMMTDHTSDVSTGNITTPIGSLSFSGKRIAEFISILSMAVLFLMAYVLYEHKEDAKSLQASFTSGFKEMSGAQREQNQILREQVCLLSLAPEKREREFMSESSFCKRLSRER